MTTPLAGITVLDFGQIYQGPYATMLMAKAGANVIKIEPPGGEPLRRRVRATGGETTLPIAMLNANKRGVTLNLKTETGRDLLKRMAARADVLLENFAPGAMDGLGCGYAVLRQINPRLIYATGTGFGISGPDRQQSCDVCHAHPLHMPALLPASARLNKTFGPDSFKLLPRPERLGLVMKYL